MVDAPSDIIHGLPADQHEYGMEKGHSPAAEKVVCVDFDGTIVPWGPLMGEKEALPGAVEGMKALKEAGYRIVIFTSRLSRTWAEHVLKSKNKYVIERFLSVQRAYVVDTLRKNDIPFNDVTAEKVPAEAYFDDKAWGVSRYLPLGDAIDAFLGGEE